MQHVGFREDAPNHILGVQGDHGGQQLHFVDFIFEVQKSCPTANFQLPKQNKADN